MRNGVLRWLRAPLRDKIKPAEVLGYLVLAQLWIRLFSMRRITDTLGSVRTVGFQTPKHDNLADAAQLGRWVHIVSARLPWQVNCLPQAIAFKWMLMRRGWDATIYFGAKPERRDTGAIAAHAWVGIGSRILVGGSQSRDYTVLSAFA